MTIPPNSLTGIRYFASRDVRVTERQIIFVRVQFFTPVIELYVRKAIIGEKELNGIKI